MTELSASLPPQWAAVTDELLATARERNAERWQMLLANEDVATSFARVWACSDFVAQACVRSPEWLQMLVENKRLRGPLDIPAIDAEFAHVPVDAPDSEVMRVLRKVRQREMMGIAWRDLAGWVDIEATLVEQSALADACIRFAYERAYAQLTARFGVPTRADGSPQPLIVIAMGKLGAHE